jgi:integrase
MQQTQGKIIFTIRDTLKTSLPGKHLDPIVITAYDKDVRLCTVTHIDHYIRKTQPIRQHSLLLLSYNKPLKPITNSTVARWVKSTLKESGIDTSQFSAHSSRSAAASYGATSGLPLQDILKAGGWSSEVTFAKHYNKPINPNLGHIILHQFSSQKDDKVAIS